MTTVFKPNQAKPNQPNMKTNSFPTDTLAALLGVMTLLVVAMMHLGFDALDLAFSARCVQHYLNESSDTPPLSQFEQVMCILG